MVLMLCRGFFATGDFVFSGFLEDIESFLDAGIKVALIHGDRDFRCNCKFSVPYVYISFLSIRS